MNEGYILLAWDRPYPDALAEFVDKLLETSFDSNTDRNVVLITYMANTTDGATRGANDDEHSENRWGPLGGLHPGLHLRTGGIECRPTTRTWKSPTGRH